MKDIVYETAMNEIRMLNEITIEKLSKNPYLLKISQLKNNHILSIIKQQEIDYKMQDLELRQTMYNIRVDRNNILKDNIELQKEKLK